MMYLKMLMLKCSYQKISKSNQVPKYQYVTMRDKTIECLNLQKCFNTSFITTEARFCHIIILINQQISKYLESWAQGMAWYCKRLQMTSVSSSEVSIVTVVSRRSARRRPWPDHAVFHTPHPADVTPHANRHAERVIRDVTARDAALCQSLMVRRMNCSIFYNK